MTIGSGRPNSHAAKPYLIFPARCIDCSPIRASLRVLGGEDAFIVPSRMRQIGFGNNDWRSVLSQLGFTTHAASLGKASLIVVLEAEDEDLEQIQEVIAKLDQAETATTTVEATTAAEQTR